jgi:DnaJ-related protein SCJ1
LTDEEKKEIYDRYGEDGLKQHEQRGGGGGDSWGGGFEDMFSQFFGGGARGRGQDREQQTPSVEIPIYLTMEQLYLGETIDVEYFREVLCVNWCVRSWEY